MSSCKRLSEQATAYEERRIHDHRYQRLREGRRRTRGLIFIRGEENARHARNGAMSEEQPRIDAVEVKKVKTARFQVVGDYSFHFAANAWTAEKLSASSDEVALCQRIVQYSSDEWIAAYC